MADVGVYSETMISWRCANSEEAFLKCFLESSVREKLLLQHFAEFLGFEGRKKTLRDRSAVFRASK